MATLIYLYPDQIGFWASFVLSEITGLITSQLEGGFPMVLEKFRTLVAYLSNKSSKVLSFLGINRGFRQSLLTIW
ncbi:hypothetical protein [Vibrio genomosp. F6]|uniref:Uncharacterized protein n=1 Tax=Vibrio genomosp. F6 str. FF-238 TaxID=1191298 RepID=A0A1E5D9N0_9VIBR|nr:hypothetical protein [Vibrio genomosp. F6]OEE80453.1 hypothetical protein A130_10150 [Vibrio genomosp. F6 str. FF-238]